MDIVAYSNTQSYHSTVDQSTRCHLLILNDMRCPVICTLRSLTVANDLKYHTRRLLKKSCVPLLRQILKSKLGHREIYHIISNHITSNHIISYHTISYHIKPYYKISYYITSYHIKSNHFISYYMLIISYHIISYHIISEHIILFDLQEVQPLIFSRHLCTWVRASTHFVINHSFYNN